MKKMVLLSSLIILVLLLAWVGKQNVQRAAKLYLYGFPIVVMEQTRETMLAQQDDAVNRLIHSVVFPDHRFRNTVRPNIDTLYTTAWIDLDAEPVVMSVPSIKDRYYVAPLMDMWTNVYATIGTRTHQEQAVNALIVGPDWQGEAPEGLSLIRSPTRHNWLIVRIQTNGKQDIPQVREIQSQFALQTYSQWKSATPRPSGIRSADPEKRSEDPLKAVLALSALDYSQLVARLIGREGVPESESELAQEFSELAQSLQQSKLKRAFYDRAFTLVQKRIRTQLDNREANENGWMVRRSGIGRYGDNYSLRAAVSMIGLAALPPEEAVYPNTERDVDGKPLNGQYRYQIRFAPGQTPPVDAFWSLSVYDENGFFVPSSINRYALGDRDDLNFEQDGSLIFLVQSNQPENPQANWLPSPKGRFALTMRLYQPSSRFLEGQWRVPAIERIID